MLARRGRATRHATDSLTLDRVERRVVECCGLIVKVEGQDKEETKAQFAGNTHGISMYIYCGI